VPTARNEGEDPSKRLGRASVSPRLLAIARNVAVGQALRARREVSQHGIDVLGSETVETLVLKDGRLSRLATRLATLPERERELLALKHGAGASHRAIARLTGVSASKVGPILSRVVASLRVAWSGNPS
jgi:RNA polymerase sigma-70 factor (ECF subfamily)